MEKIPLRAYNREIERLIDDDRSPEAMEHCQKILEIYPRCLDTFRLMGKAYLEMHQYDKSEEIFKKVLSFVPDDFIANLGMSLLREKQTNLEGTIWHMERAFEAQSSNTAVQNELRRLYKQRDGVDTPRIRLTRGGLVRMYIKGDMLQQALSEIQSILVDDPSRMDIRVVQADALMKAGKKEEGLQVCQQILSELPYCFEANRLLFENKTVDIKIDDVQSVQQHLRELDPYYEFTSPIQPDPISVPEEEVLVDALDGLGLKTATVNPDHNQPSSAFNAFKEATEHQFEKTDNGGWQTDLERFGEQSDEQKPSWMDELQTPTFQSEQINGTSSGNMPATQNTGFNSGKNMTTNDSSSQNEYSTAGGNQRSSGSDDANETPNPFLAIPGNSLPAAEPGDIPEWLKALASEPPAASSDAITAPLRVPGETGVLQTGEENLEFLRTLQGETSTPNQNEESPEQPEIPSPSESLSGILTPDPFLPSTENTQPVPIEEGESSPVAPSRDVPSWLRSASEPNPEPISEQSVNQPVNEDFRQDFIPENPQTSETINKSAAIKNQYQSPQPEFETPTQAASPESIPSNLQETLDKVRRETDSKEQPDWLKHENLGSDIAALFEETKAPEEKTPEGEGEPDWMAQLREENEAHPEPASSTTPISVPNVPDWLFTQEDTGGATAPIQSDAPVTHQPPPDWLAAARPDIFAQDFQAEEEKPVETPVGPSLSASLDFSTSREEAVLPGMLADEETPPSETQPDLSFLDSQPVDFMNADRRPLTDNLVMPEQPFGSRNDTDISRVAPAESLQADLAAMLREEAESEFTTNPLEPDSAPEITLDKIPGLASSTMMDEFKAEKPQIEEPQFFRDTIPDSETVASVAQLSSHPEEVTSSADLISQPEASSPVFEPFNRPIPDTIAPTEFFSEPEFPEVPEETPSMEIGIAASKPLTRPVESLPPMDFFVSPVVDEKPVPAEKPLADIPTIEEIIEAVTPKVKEPELVNPTLFIESVKPAIETEPEQFVKKPIEGKTIPVSSLPAFEVPVVEEKSTPQIVVGEPVVPIPAPQPVVEKPVVPIPVVQEPPALQPVVKEPVVREPVSAKPAAPKPVIEKPVVKAPVPEPRIAKPVRPSTPKPVRYEEKTVPVQPSIQRKNAGSADLVRAREAFAKGDINTALRRYIKLINSNKALDSVSGDLKEIVRKHPKDYLAWQTYGDARLRSNRIQEALDAYAKAADLLK